eukprot:CAMPEP_0118802410 /NCGR_PEP_ID=MMETSP1161-20130426/7450_1 /TAXON_ID=249345 /ORGANISM="Picochlorum oklahomensis, Strain CCMP2329" /LENGTH=108 /DNA_ID=CAMNT_0006730617 /DNA_START=44 /DNA_END=367 /DNA_ORIENTATION=-
MGRVLVIISNSAGNLAQENGQRKVKTWLSARNVAYVEVEATIDADERRKLTGISGKVGGYPQVFIERAQDDIEYVGDYEKLLELIEAEEIPANVVEANNIPTFSTVFK